MRVKLGAPAPAPARRSNTVDHQGREDIGSELSQGAWLVDASARAADAAVIKLLDIDALSTAALSIDALSVAEIDQVFDDHILALMEYQF